MRAVILGTAKSNGQFQKLKIHTILKAFRHIKAGTYPKEADMVDEMEAVAAVFKKYDVRFIDQKSLKIVIKFFQEILPLLLKIKL